MSEVGKTIVVNEALQLLGQENVADLSDAALAFSNAAVKLLRQIEGARDFVLSRHGWTCALEYVTLTPAIIPGYENWRYPTVYLLPADALRVWEIGGLVANGQEIQCWGPRWQIGTTEVSGSSQLVIRATADPGTLMGDWYGDGGFGWSTGPASASAALAQSLKPTGPPAATGPLPIAYVRRADWQALDNHVRTAVAVELAARAAYTVTGDVSKQLSMRKEAEAAVLLAVSTEGNQEGFQPPLAPSMPRLLRAYSR